MKLRGTLLGLALTATAACGGGERGEIEALIEEIVSLQGQQVEEWERIAAIVRESQQEPWELMRELTIREWTERAESVARRVARNEGRLRDAAARDAWDEVFLLGLGGMTPVEFLQDMKTKSEGTLKTATDRRLAIVEQRRRRAIEEQAATRDGTESREPVPAR